MKTDDDLLNDLWQWLKKLDSHCDNSIAHSVTLIATANISGQQIAIREVQNWLMAHGYKPAKQNDF